MPELCVLRAGAVEEHRFAFRIAGAAYVSPIGVNHTSMCSRGGSLFWL